MSELDQYDYHLPRELIAQEPLPKRVDARLMVVRRATQGIEHALVSDLPQLLDSGDAVVLNDTRVLPARISGYRTRTGGRWDGLFLSADDRGLWRVLCKTRGTPVAGETIRLFGRNPHETVDLRLLSNLGDGQWMVRPEPEGNAYEILEAVGRVPLPHYIRGGRTVDFDRERYQTVFAKTPGAVAAPTAGLHFSFDLLRDLQERGIELMRVTLHVGMGTFRPITVDKLGDHEMHSEWGSIEKGDAEQLNDRRKAGGRIVAIGTTCVRVLETAADDQGKLHPWSGETSLFIRPPYHFKAVDALMTNFHLPKTSLLVLVRTFGGDELIRRAYDVAIRDQYRFYSYGDAMLIL